MNPITILYVLWVSLMKIRDDREKGIRIDWFKTAVTMIGVFAVVGLGIGVLFLVANGTGDFAIAMGAFIGVLVVGLIAVIVAVNRWKPVPPVPPR